MKVRFVSDLHLEINRKFPKFITGTNEEYLGVAGDTVMARCLRKNANDAFSRSHKRLFLEFLNNISSFKKVFFILGNHEHYTGHIDESFDLFEEFIELNFPNNEKFYVLENRYHFLNDTTILVGATLWTDMGKDNSMSHYNVGRGMNDFRIIKCNDGSNVKTFDTVDAMRIHHESRDFIQTIAKAHSDMRIIVATHHAPHYTSNGVEHTASQIIDGYCSDLSELIMDNTNITDWLHGHTHTFMDYDIGQCRVRSNQLGYDMERIYNNFTEKRYNESFVNIE